jgi:hypothetical protein
MKPVFKRIVSMSYYRVRCKPGYGGVTLTLECGHVMRRKQSQVPMGTVKVKCRECTMEAWCEECKKESVNHHEAL